MQIEKGAINDCYHVGYFLGRMSSSINGNGLSSSSTIVGYDKVIELLGENGEAGKTEHIFYNGEDASPSVPFLPGNRNPLNGKEAVTFITDAAGKAVKKIDYNYETKYSNYLKGVKIYQPPFFDGSSTYSSYYVNYYDNTSYWTVLNSQKETIYTSAGTLANSKIFYYDNADHMEVTRQEFISSDGKTETKKFKYPGDYPSAGSSSFVSQLKQNNIISPIIEEQTFVVNNNIKKLIGGTFTEYKLFYNAFYKPAISYKIYSNTPLSDLTESDISSSNIITLHPNSKPEVYFDNYDPLGNIRTLHKANDIPKSYVWGYNGTYPVAEATNAASNEIFFDSFEESGTTGTSHTGRKYYNGDYTLNFSPPVGKSYKYSYWYREGGIWKLSGELNYLGNVTLTAGDAIDDVRVYPNGAQMSSYTYDPLIGNTSKTDLNNKTTSYEYDGFGRLMHVRDQNKNILKKYCYNYAGQAVDCKPTNLPGVYARISYENQYNNGGLVYGNVVLRLYQNEACTVPLAVNNMSFNYNYFFPCYESHSSFISTVTVTGNSYVLKQNEVLSYQDTRDVPLGPGSWTTEQVQCFTKYYLISNPAYQIILSN